MHRLTLLALLFLAGCPGCPECFEDQDCFGQDVCVDGACLECKRDRDCDDDESCEDGICRQNRGGPGDPCEDDEQCIPETVCFNQFCVGRGLLRVSLAFDVDSDFDLHVVTPEGVEIYYAAPTGGGGELDVDQCIQPCGTETHVENIVFNEALPPGTYTVFVVNYDGRAGGDFRIEVAGATSQTYAGSLTAVRGEQSQSFTFTL